MSSRRRLNSMLIAAGFPWLGKRRSLSALEVPAQRDGLAQVNVTCRAVRVAMHHHANNPRERSRHVDLAGAEERHGAQTHPARRDSRELGVQVVRARED